MNFNFIENIRVKLFDHYLQCGDRIEEDNDFKKEIELLLQKIILNMLQSTNAFFANFIIKFKRQINYNVDEPFSTEPSCNYFILHINPLLMLQCNTNEIEALLKHEIYHIICLHQVRAKELVKHYSRLAVNLAIDIAVNQFIANLPSWSVTLEAVNLSYNLNLIENQSVESYTKAIDEAIRMKKQGKTGVAVDNNNLEPGEKKDDFTNYEYNHNTWINATNLVEDDVFLHMVNKSIEETKHIQRPNSVNLLIRELHSKPQISWEKYLRTNLGKMPWNKKRTITRKDRRMPDRLDLRGTLSHHISNLVVAIDISGSMTEKEIDRALVEIKAISFVYNTKITVLECDEEIRNTYSIDKFHRYANKPKAKGKTKFLPVFKYIKNNFDSRTILIYFTDGLGEEKIPDDIIHNKTLWVLTSSDKTLSLKNIPGKVFQLKESRLEKDKDNTLPLEYLKTEMKEIRSEWAK